jgi:hypothetical protein
MRNFNNKDNKIGFNSSVLFEEDIPNNDIRRVVAKLASECVYESLSAVARSINITNVVPSTLDIIMCNKILIDYSKTNVGHLHPRNNVEVFRDNSPFMMDDFGVKLLLTTKTKEENEKVIVSKVELDNYGKPLDKDVYINNFGLVSNDTIDIQFASATSLVTYATKEIGNNILNTFSDNKDTTAIGIPKVDLSQPRRQLRTYEKSATLSQGLMYAECKKKPLDGISFVDNTYSRVGKFGTTSDVNTKALKLYLKNEAKRNHVVYVEDENRKAFIPAVCKPNFSAIPDSFRCNLAYVWTFALRSQSARGDEGGIGAITSGYYNYEMPSHFVKATARAREIIRLCKISGVHAVRLPSGKEFNSLTVEILVFNGISVIQEGGIGVYQKGRGAGFYNSTDELVLRVIKNPVTVPIYEQKIGVTMDIKDFEDRMKIFSVKENQSDLRMVLTFYTPQVVQFAKDNNFLIYPSLSPHMCKVWLICFNMKEMVKVPSEKEHIGRFHDSISCRNMWPFTRRPFAPDDVMTNFFEPYLLIPQITRKTKKQAFSILPAQYEIIGKIDAIATEMDICIKIAMEVDEVAKIIFLLEASVAQSKYKDVSDIFSFIYEENPLYVSAFERMKRDDRYITIIKDYSVYEMEREKKEMLENKKQEDYQSHFRGNNEERTQDIKETKNEEEEEEDEDEMAALMAINASKVYNSKT